MVVANDVTNDTRVLKEAIALGEAGYRVTLLGVSASGRLAIDTIDGGVVVIRLPARFVLRDERHRRRRLRRTRRILTVAPAPAQAARVAARLADLKAESGRALANRRAKAVGPLTYRAGRVRRSLKYRRWWLSQVASSLRTWLAELEARRAAEFWQWWDEWLPAQSRPVRWRSVIPEADDYEAVFAELLDQLRPDVLHAHDMHVIGVASRAAGRAALRGRTMKVVYDAHEYVPGLSQYGGRTPRMIAAWAQHEREYIRTADRVVTVSPAIARTLRRRYRLDREPTVVINSPLLVAEGNEITDVRAAAGLPADRPLLVYSGRVTRARGVETAVSALPRLPDVHLAVVCVPSIASKPVDELRRLAASLQVEDRVHYLDPVAPSDVLRFLRTADIGLIPILRYPSHEMALPNKVFEYTFAGLPVVTSDMPTLEEFVGKTGVGEVFTAENPDDLAAAVSRVLLDPKPYRERASDPGLRDQMSWQTQAAHLRTLYADLVGAPPTAASGTVRPRLVMGPIGSKAAIGWSRDIDEAEIQRRPVALANLDGITHLLMEDWQSVLGSEDLTADLPLLSAARIKHGVIVYGRGDRQQLRRRIRAYDGTVFVTDSAIAEAVAGTQWLPPGAEGVQTLRAFMTGGRVSLD
jgi:glycosyltransferase involved in cell wall biosynthesis